MSAKKNNNISKLTFEQAIKELGGIVGSIEEGQESLEDSLGQYERGMALIAHCRDILQKAQKRIETISKQQRSEDGKQKTE